MSTEIDTTDTSVPQPLVEQLRRFRETHRYQQLVVDGVKWTYIACGRGDEGLLVLGGGLSTGESSFRTIIRLEKHFRVVSPFYPPVGRMGAVCDGLAAILDAEGLTRAHAYGHSLEAAVAHIFVRRYPPYSNKTPSLRVTSSEQEFLCTIPFFFTGESSLMLMYAIAHLFSVVLDWLAVQRLSQPEKDFELLLLRYQLAIVQRHLQRTPPLAPVEKLTLTVLTVKFRALRRASLSQLRHVIRLFQPETVLRWHREWVQPKWRASPSSGGRPGTPAKLEGLVLRLARENPAWGYGKIQGELKKLGYRVSITTVARFLRRHHRLPAPQRAGSVGWRQLMRHYKDQLLACDCFTVETLFLKTVDVLFFIEVGPRRVHIAGYPTHPTPEWVTQQARQLVWMLQEQNASVRFLIHDRDSKFTRSFDTVFASESIHVIRTPSCAADANAFAERWVRTIREECLDKLSILNEGHLGRTLRTDVDYYNRRRPHPGIGQQTPLPDCDPLRTGRIDRRDILGGILHDYDRVA